MIDQAQIDLLQLVGGDLKRVARTQGGEWAGACPFCGGRDRFRVWPHRDPPRWWCRQCERHGDAVSFVQQREQVAFGEALRLLGLNGQARTYQPTPAPARPPDQNEPPDPAWQAAARAFVQESVTALYGDYRKPLDWLHRRGFTDPTIQQAQIGYHSGDLRLPRADWGLETDDTHQTIWLPRGVVIPWFNDGQLWRVFIRRPTGEPKYVLLPGGGNAIYGADTIHPDRPLVLVEGAFDALALQQAAGDLCAAAAVGTTSGRTIRWISQIAGAAGVLLAFDGDAGGDPPTAFWRSVLGDRAHLWRPPQDDPAALLELGDDVRAWVQAGLAAAAATDPALWEAWFGAALDAQDGPRAEALAELHADPAGVRVFLHRLQAQAAEDEPLHHGGTTVARRLQTKPRERAVG